MADDFDDKLWEYFTRDVKKINANYYHSVSDVSPLNHKKILLKRRFDNYSVQHKFDIRNLSLNKDDQQTLLYQSPVKLKRPHILGRLDLHGFNQQAAYEKLCRFIIIHYERQQRSLLVITGKGKRSLLNAEVTQGGVLRLMLPQWLESPALRHYVIHYCTAAPQDGGNGAFYIKLKKF